MTKTHQHRKDDCPAENAEAAIAVSGANGLSNPNLTDFAQHEGDSSYATIQSFTEFYQTSEYAAFDQDVREGGTFGLKMLDVKQGAVEMTDPAMSDVAFVTSLTTGGGTFETDFGDGWRKHSFKPSIMDIQPPFQDCSFRVPAAHLRFATLPEAEIRRLLDERGLTLATLDAFIGHFKQSAIAASALNDMWRLSQIDDPSTSLIIDGLVMNLIGHLLLEVNKTHAPKPAAAIGDARLRRVIDYIEEDLSKPLCVGDLASVACMSITQFSRSFRSALGITPAKYVQQRRCDRAANLLQTTQFRVATISAMCGFRNFSYFSTVFKKETGHRPADLRC